MNAPTFVNQKKVFSKKENPSMTLISRHSILSLQPTQFPFMYGLKQSVRWTAYKYLISKQWQLKKSLPMRSYNSIICVFIGIPGRFDTNGFIMGTGSFSLTFYSKLDGITPQQLKNSLQVRSYKGWAVWSKKN